MLKHTPPGTKIIILAFVLTLSSILLILTALSWIYYGSGSISYGLTGFIFSILTGTTWYYIRSRDDDPEESEL